MSETQPIGPLLMFTEELELSNNQLTGVLPESLGNLKALGKHLDQVHAAHTFIISLQAQGTEICIALLMFIVP